MKTSFNKNQLVFGLLALVVVASGCTSSEGTEVDYTQNTGITVEEFDAFPDSVISGTQVQLNTRIKNTGGATASNVQLTVFNIPAEAWGNTDGFNIGEPTPLVDGELRGPDRESEIPASPVTNTFSMDAPDLNQGVVIPYDIMGKITYDYYTTGVTEVVVMGQQRWRENQPARGTPSVDNSGGPVQISVNTRSPIILFDDTSTANQLCVQLDNVGDGRVSLPDAGSDDADNKVELSHDSQSSGVSLTAMGEGGQNQGDGVVTMNNGEGTTCYNVEASGTQDNLKTTIPITFTASYNYEKEVSTPVTVEGQ